MPRGSRADRREALLDALMELKEFKRVDKATAAKIIKEAIEEILMEKFGTLEPFAVNINPDTGAFEIWQEREVVPDDEVEDELTQIGISEAQAKDPDLEEGDIYVERLDPAKIFERRRAYKFKDLLLKKLAEHHKEKVYQAYRDKIGDFVVGEVHQVYSNRDILALDDEGIELYLPEKEQIYADRYKKGDIVKAIVKRVEKSPSGDPIIIISRKDPRFLERLLESEVIEIMDGLLKIHKVVRFPGKRAKVLIESLDDRIDPVGAVVGPRGTRIHAVVRELRGETIDVVPYTNDIHLLIARALTPARVSAVEIDPENKQAIVYVPPDQISLAVGKEGINIKLASKLTGYDIDVVREEAKPIEERPLIEFADLLGEGIVREFIEAGLDTVGDVLEQSLDDLKKMVGLDAAVVEDVVRQLTQLVEQNR
ncbi:MAG: transcription termination factor NusA [Chlorobi bacterium]|nr:transcription termination factor NusA [Chlorobiota bacterium]